MQFSFLMCSERSGSNLITKIMDSHSLICGPSPVHLFRYLIENRPRYANVKEDNNWKCLLRDTVDLFNTKIGIWRTEWDVEKLKASLAERSLLEVLKTIYQIEAEANGKTRLFVKENHLYRFMPFILDSFSDSRIVFWVRDPRDMVLSWKRSPILRGCVIRAAKTWKEDQSQGLKVYSDLQKMGKIILVKYEDLLSDTLSELHRICTFLEVDYEPQMQRFRDNDLTTDNARCTSAWENLQEPIKKSNFNKFLEGLSEQEIRYVEALCRKEMKLLGYDAKFDNNHSIDELRVAIAGNELYEKPAYKKVNADEQEIRRKNLQVLKKIRMNL